jgi:hypothetical protein
VRIPDLQSAPDEVTLDHVSVLLERLHETMGDMYDGDKEEFKEMCEEIDPVRMKAELLSMLEEKAFLKLFSSQFGKGVLLGAFIQRFIFNEETEE